MTEDDNLPHIEAAAATDTIHTAMPPPPQHSFPRLDEKSELPRIAVRRLHKIVDGNGIKAENVTLKSFEGALYRLEAQTHIRPLLTQTSRTEPGKKTGPQICNSPQDLHNAIEALEKDLPHNAQSQDILRKAVLERPDQGIGLDKETIRVPSLDKSYVNYNPCNACREKGQVECIKCHGRKQIDCIQCHGQGRENCVQCHGHRTITGPGGKRQPCPHCSGQGKLSCRKCAGRRQMPCEQCNGHGQMRCQKCNGHATFSDITNVEVQIIAHNELIADKDQIPDNALRQAERLGNRLISGGHAKATALPASSEEPQSGTSDLLIHYTIDIPYGEAVFSIENKDENAILFGNKAKIMGLNPFLESKVSSFVQTLSVASKNGSTALTQLGEVWNYKIFKEALNLAARARPDVVYQKLLSKYSLALKKQTIQIISDSAEAILSTATKGPLKTTRMILSALFCAIFAGLYLSPAHTAIKAAIPMAQLSIVVDILILIGALLLATPLSQMISSYFLTKQLSGTVPPQQLKPILNRLKKADIWGLFFIFLIFLMFYAAIDLFKIME